MIVLLLATTVVDGNPCGKAHHHLLHEAHIAGITFHQTSGKPGKILLMVCNTKSYDHNLTTILDPCSNLSLITHDVARTLNLKGKYCVVSVTKVGNVVDTEDSKEYELHIHE